MKLLIVLALILAVAALGHCGSNRPECKTNCVSTGHPVCAKNSLGLYKTFKTNCERVHFNCYQDDDFETVFLNTCDYYWKIKGQAWTN